MEDHHAQPTSFPPAAPAPRERGYALIALLALMTLMMFAAMAVAPSVRHQSQRERELEAIARGEEVAEAIRAFTHITRGRLPTSMEELQEGAPFGTKKIQVLRASAARDPLSESGEWRLIKTQDREFPEFMRALTLYTNGRPLASMSTDRTMQAFAPNIQLTNILDLGEEEEAPGGEITTITSKGPFVGVASRSQRQSVIAYYGIERHDKWVFTPLFK